MSFETMRTFFAFAALLANVSTIALVVAAIYGRVKGTNPFEVLRGTTLWLASGVAIFATLGSLYLSEIAHLIPCRYCWWQRIAMYPLAVILPIAAFRKDHGIRIYAAVLALIGAGIAFWHRLIQEFPDLDSGACSITGPSCTAPLIKMYGFVTIPYMALSGFLFILALLYADRVNNPRGVPTSPDAPSQTLADGAQTIPE